MSEGIGVFLPKKENVSEEEFLFSVFKAKEIRKIDGEDYVILDSDVGELRIPVRKVYEYFIEMFDTLGEEDRRKLMGLLRGYVEEGL
ncbi:MAG: hypothetical protein GXO66_02220 [Euryarchaeota archaeon]|nr:hypothetical protein [Euryarchaeota archaeon]